MGFPWIKLFQIGKAVAPLVAGPVGAIIGAVTSAVDSVEDNLPGLKGPDKKVAAEALARGMVEAVEAGAGKDVLNDAAVVEATSQFIDAYVAFRNAEAQLRVAIETAKASRVA